MMTKFKQTLSYVITLLVVLVLSTALLASCGNPRKGLKIEYELMSTEKAITYDSDGKAFLSLTKEFDENGNLTNVGKANIDVKVLNGANNLLRTIRVESSDPAKVGYSCEYDSNSQTNHVQLFANGATAQNDSTYVQFISEEDSTVFATLYVRVDEKATSMDFADNINVVRDGAGNQVITNLGAFDGVPFHLLTNKLFKFGPSQATTPNLLFSVGEIFNFVDGSEFVYSSSSLGSATNVLRENVTVSGTYADGTSYKAIEFRVINADDKTNETFIKKFRIPVYENLSSNVLTITKNSATQSSVELETVFEQVQTPRDSGAYIGLYVISVRDGVEEYVLVTEANLSGLSIVPGTTAAYKKADVDTRIVFINNKNRESGNISLTLEPANENIYYSYELTEPESAYTYLSAQENGLNRESAYIGKYIKQNGKYVLITKDNFSSLNIIIGQTPCYSYSGTITIAQNSNFEGEKLNSFSLYAWRESLSGTYLTFRASYAGFLEDDEITIIPKAEKTIEIKVVNYPTQIFVNDKGVSFVPLENSDGTLVTSFTSVENFLGEDGSGLYYFRTGETINTYAYTLITKDNYSITNYEIVINGTSYELDYRNFAGTILFEEAADEISVFDVYNTSSLSQSIMVELNGFSEGFDEFYVYVNSQELARNGDKYRNALIIAEALRLVCDGRNDFLKQGDEYSKLVYKSGSVIYISANTAVSLNGEIPIVVEAKYNSGKQLQRKLILRFVRGIEDISARAIKTISGIDVEFDVGPEEDLELYIPASGDLNSVSLRSNILLFASPDNSATYQSIIDGTVKTYLTLQNSNSSVVKVGYFNESEEFVENAINPMTLSFVIIGQKFGNSEIVISSPTGVRFTFEVYVKEIASAITLNLDEDSAPNNTFQTTKKITEDDTDERTTLTSLMLTENVTDVYVNANVYPANASLLKSELFYITKEKYNALYSSGEDEFKSVLLEYMLALEPSPLGYLDGINTNLSNKKIVADLVTSKKIRISTFQKNESESSDGVDEGDNECFICVAFVYEDENNTKQIAINYFSISVYRAVTSFVSTDGVATGGVVSASLLAAGGASNPYLDRQTQVTLSVDIGPSGTDRTVSKVIWYFVDGEELIRSGITEERQEIGGRLVTTGLSYNKVTVSAVSGSSSLQTFYANVTDGTSSDLPVLNKKYVPQYLQDVITENGKRPSASYNFFVGQKIMVQSKQLNADDFDAYLHNIRACILDVNGIVWTVKFAVTVNKIVLTQALDVYDYDEDDGIYFETAQKMSSLPLDIDGVTVVDRLAKQNSYGYNDVDAHSQKQDINVSVAAQTPSPTLANLEYILFDADVKDGIWSVAESANRSGRQYSSSSVWLGINETTNKYFVTPIKYGYTILYVIPQDQMIKKNEDIVTSADMTEVLNAITNSQVVKEFHITVADGYKTYIRLSSAQDFEKLYQSENAWDKNYYITNDIDLSGLDLDVIGTYNTPFSGKITSMPFAITVDGVQTSIIPTYTIYGIRLKDTNDGNSRILNADTYSYFGLFGVFAGTIEKVNFRFDSVSLETNITAGAFQPDMLIGALAGNVLGSYDYKKTYETIEGYYGKAVYDEYMGEYVVVDESNASTYIKDGDYDSIGRRYRVDAYMIPTLKDMSVSVQEFDYKLTRNAGANFVTVYAGVIGSNKSSKIAGIKINITAEMFEQANNLFTCVFGGFIGANNGAFPYVEEGVNSNIEVNTNLVIQTKGNSVGIVGGVVGQNEAEISNIIANGSIVSRGHANEVYNAGGICGSSSGVVRNCYSSVSVWGGQNIGGIVGYQDGNKIEDCVYSIYAGTTSALYGESCVGGIAGVLDGADVVSSYVMSYDADNKQEICGTSCVGALVGQVMNTSAIRKSFVSASAQGEIVGGIVGALSGSSVSLTIENVFVKGDIITTANNTDNAGLILGARNMNASVTKSYVSAAAHMLVDNVLIDVQIKVNAYCAPNCGVYVLDTSFNSESGEEEVTELTVEHLRDKTAIDGTEFYKNSNMPLLDFFNGGVGDTNPWTVTEQNEGEPILKGLYPTIPTDIVANRLSSNLTGVYNISNTEIIISLSDYYKTYGNNLTNNASKFFELQILPNTTDGLALVNTNEDAKEELQHIWINVQNTNASILQTAYSNLYDLTFTLSGQTGTTNLTLSCAQNTNAKITLSICVIEGFDEYTFSNSSKTYNTDSETAGEEDDDNKLISIQKGLSDRINVSYTQIGSNRTSANVVSPSHLNAGFAICYEEGYFTFGADKFSQVAYKETEESEEVIVLRQDVLREFVASGFDVNEIKKYYPSSTVSLIDESEYYLIEVDGYYYAKILKTEYKQEVTPSTLDDYVGKYIANEGSYILVTEDNKNMLSISPNTTEAFMNQMFVYAYYENSSYITIFGNEKIEKAKVTFTKYYIFENGNKKVAYYLDDGFNLYVKVYSGISSLNVNGGSHSILDIDKRAPSDEFSSEITFVSDSTTDLKWGTNITLYLQQTQTIHANNTIVYDDEYGINPQVYANIEDYYGKYLKTGDDVFVQITTHNAMLDESGLMLVVLLDDEGVVVFESFVDVDVDEEHRARSNTVTEEFKNKFIPGLEETRDASGNITLQVFKFALMQSYYKNLDEILVFRMEVENTDKNAKLTQQVFFEFAPIRVNAVSVSHYTDADLEEGDGTMASNYLTNAGIIPTNTILAGDYGLLQIDFIPEYGSFNKLTVSGVGTNGDEISFVQRVKNTYTAKVNNQIVTQTRYYLFDAVSQNADGTINPQAVSNYDDGMVSIMLGSTILYMISASTESETKEALIAGEYYYKIDGDYIRVTEENYDLNKQAFSVTTTYQTINNFSNVENNGFYYKYQQNYVLVKDLVNINENTKKLKVRDISFDFDGTIYLQTLIARQTTAASLFNISIDVEYDGETQNFTQALEADTSSTLAWIYSGIVKDAKALVQEAYMPVGTTNQNLSLEIVGEFNSLLLTYGNDDESGTGKIYVTEQNSSNIYQIDTHDAKIGDVFTITVIGQKNVSGYVRKIQRRIKINVVDYILHNGAFQFEESSNDILDKVYTSDASYRLTIIPNFDNIEISSSEPKTFASKETYVGYYYKDENKVFHKIVKEDENVVIDGLPGESVNEGETLAYTEELKNLWTYVYAFNTDVYQTLLLKTVDSFGGVEDNRLEEQANGTTESDGEDYAFTKVKYKASTIKDAEDSLKEEYEAVNTKSKLPNKTAPYYYIKYVYFNGNNNGFYICPLSQGYGSVLYITDMDYGYDNGVLTLCGGIKVANEELPDNTYTYTNISSDVELLQGIVSYGTEIRFSQKTSIDHPIPIYTEEEFLAMGAGNHYILMNDLTFNGGDSGAWAPINTPIASLDGNGKIIKFNYKTFSDVSGTATNPANVGFFGTVASETLLKNLVIELGVQMEAIDYREVSGLNFGVLAGTNDGIITNCAIMVSDPSSQTTVKIVSSDRQTDVFQVGGFVGVNNGSITNSRVQNMALTANGLVAGFVCENNGVISASYVNFGSVKNSSTQTSTSKTAGFVLKNSVNAKVASSYVGMAYLEEYFKDGKIEQEVKQTQTVVTNVDIGGFVYENLGEISDSFSAIKLSSDTSFNASSGGFVLMNQSGGTIVRCYSISSTQSESFANAPFVGPNKQTGYNTLNYGSLDAFVDCFYYNDSFGSVMVQLTEALSIKSLTKDQFLNTNNYYAECFENYSVSRYYNSEGYEYSSVWAFANLFYKSITTDKLLPNNILQRLRTSSGSTINLLGPQLVYANLVLQPEREVKEYDDSDPAEPKYIYTENSSFRLGNTTTKLNVRVIDSAKSLIENFNADLDADVGDKSLDDWYRLVANIDLTGVDLSNYVNKTFTGNFDGNGFTISGINITSAKENYCGFFGKIATQLVPETKEEKTYYVNADSTIASVHNLRLSINAITATEVVSVGGLCGEAENAILSNIDVTATDVSDIQIVGKNLVGGVVGKLYGNSRAYNITSEASVSAVYAETYTNKLIYNSDLLRAYTKEIDESVCVLDVHDAVKASNSDSVLCYAGTVFGVADLSPFSQEAVIVTQTGYNDARISNIKSYGTSKVVGGTVGGVFGLVGASTYVNNAQKIVVNGSYIKGGRFSGGIVGENHGILNYVRVNYTPTLQDAVDELIVGAVNENANIDLFRSQSAIVSEQAKAVGGLVGFNIGLSLSLVSEINTGAILNSNVKVRVDDQTSSYLGGLVGIAIGGVFNSNFVTGSTVGASVGVTGGAIGFVADFMDSEIRQTIANPFDGIEYDSFMLKDRKYYISNSEIIDITTSEHAIIALTEDENFQRFKIDGETYYLNNAKTVVYNNKVDETNAKESVVAFVNKRSCLSMDEQTLILNNIVARNNYAYTDYYRIQTIIGGESGANGVFGGFIGKTSLYSNIDTQHQSPELDATKEYNFYVSQIYSTQQPYTREVSAGLVLNEIGYDLRETRTWESFIVVNEGNTIITINGNKYIRGLDTLNIEEKTYYVNAGEFSIDEEGFIIISDQLYHLNYVSDIETTAESKQFAIGDTYYVIEYNEDEPIKISNEESEIDVENIDCTYNYETYNVFKFELNDKQYLIRTNVIVELEEITLNTHIESSEFVFNGTTFTLYNDSVRVHSENATISPTNYVTVRGVNYYLEDIQNNNYKVGKYIVGDANNVFKVSKEFAPLATGLTRYEMYAGSYQANRNNNRMFSHWNVYNYGTKQAIDDTYKIVNYDKAMMPIYNPTTDVDEVKIYTVEDFLNMQPTGKYRLMNDLDFEYQNVCLFRDEPFTGIFIGASDSMGDGETIHTLFNVNPTWEVDEKVLYAGIFNKTQNATIEKLNISGVGKMNSSGELEPMTLSNNFVEGFGILIGKAVDTQINEINITEDYNYIASYINIMATNTEGDNYTNLFAIGENLYEITSGNVLVGENVTQFKQIGESIAAVSADADNQKSFKLNGTTYYLFEDCTQIAPYSYSTNLNGTDLTQIGADGMFTIGSTGYYLFKNNIYESIDGAETNCESNKITIDGETYRVDKRVVYNTKAYIFKIGGNTYQIQDGEYIYKQIAETNSDELVSRIIGGRFMLDGITYTYSDGKVWVFTLTSADTENKIDLKSVPSGQYVGGLVGRYEAKELPENKITNINIECDISVEGKTSSVGGAVGLIQGVQEYRLLMQNVVYEGSIEAECDSGNFGGIIGWAENVTFAGSLVLADMDIKLTGSSSTERPTVGGFAGKLDVKNEEESEPIYCEGIIVLNDMTVRIENDKIDVGGFAGEFSSRLYNSVIAPNITLESNEISKIDNYCVAGFVANFRENALSYNGDNYKPVQNVLILTTTYNHTILEKVFAVVEESATLRDWSSNVFYDQNLSLVEGVQTNYQQTSENLFNAKAQHLFVEEIDGLDFLRASLKNFGAEDKHYTLFEMNEAISYPILNGKLEDNTKSGSKIQPLQVVNKNPDEYQKGFADISASAEDKYLWYVQNEDIDDIDLLSPVNLNGFYNGNNKRITPKAIDGVYGEKTEQAQIGAFNLYGGSTVSSLSFVAEVFMDNSRMLNINITNNDSGATNVKIGTMAAFMDGNSVMYACVSNGKLQVQNTNKTLAVGGLVGVCQGQIIACGSNTDLYIAGDVQANVVKYVGGLVGVVVPTSDKMFNIKNSFYNGIIKTKYVDAVGGLVGASLQSSNVGPTIATGNIKLKDSYTFANIVGSDGDAVLGAGTMVAEEIYYADKLAVSNPNHEFNHNSYDSVFTYKGTMNEGTNIRTINGLIRTDNRNEWGNFVDEFINSGLPVCAPLNSGCIISRATGIETEEGTTTTYVCVKNELELAYYISTSAQGKEYVLDCDMNYGTMDDYSVADSRKFEELRGTLNGNGHKIDGLNNNYFVATNSGTIKNVEFSNNDSNKYVANSNQGIIQAVLVANGNEIVNTQNGTIENCLVGTNAIISNSESISTGKLDYANIGTKGIDFWNVWTLVGTTTGTTGDLKLQQFNKTTSTLDVFGIDGVANIISDTYIETNITNKEQYSAVVQYLDRHSDENESVEMTISSDIDFGGMNVTKLNGYITFVADDEKTLSNFSMVNTELIYELCVLNDVNIMKNITFENVNYFAESASGYDSASFIANSSPNSSTIDGVKVTNSLFNFKSGSAANFNTISTLVGDNSANMQNITVDTVVVNANFNQNLGLVAGSQNSSATINTANISNITLNATSNALNNPYVGLIAGANESGATIQNVAISGTNKVTLADIDSFGGIAGQNIGTISNFDVGNSGALSISGSAQNIGGVVGNNISEISFNGSGDGNKVTNLTIDATATNIGGLVGINGTTTIDSVTKTGTITNATVDGSVELQGNNNIGGLVGTNNGTITNTQETVGGITTNTISIDGVTITGNSDSANLGGLVGENTSQLNNMVVSNITIEGQATNIGGVVGTLTTLVPVSATVDHLDISGTATAVGGIVGTNEASTSGSTSDSIGSLGITNAKIDVTASKVGGVIGHNKGQDVLINNEVIDIEVKNNKNTKIVEGVEVADGYVGGVIGYAEAGSVGINQQITITLSEDSKQTSFGGVVGKAQNMGTITVTEAISVTTTQTTSSGLTTTNIGGVIGEAVYVDEISVNNNIALTSRAKATNVGGVIGQSNDTNTVGKNINSNSSGLASTITANIYNAQFVGGVIADLQDVANNLTVNLQGTINLTTGTAADVVGGVIGKMGAINATSSNIRAFGIINVIHTAAASNSVCGGLVGLTNREFEYYSSSANSNTLTINSSASVVGGVVGKTNKNVTATINNDAVRDTFTINGTSTSEQQIGGIVGQQENNSVSITADVSGNASNFVVRAYPNGVYDVNNIHNNTCVGGVVATNIGTINKAIISGMTLSGKHYVGGIAGKNTGNINTPDNSNYAQVKGDVHITAVKESGLVVGVNSGTINGNGLNAILTDTAGANSVTYTGTTDLGIAISVNTGRIEDAFIKLGTSGTSSAYTISTISTEAQNVGLYVANNTGTIFAGKGAGALVSNDTYEVTLSAENSTNVGIFGYNNGTAGNTGKISCASIKATNYNIVGKENVGVVGNNNSGTFGSQSETETESKEMDIELNKASGTTNVGAIGLNNTSNLPGKLTATVTTLSGEENVGGVIGKNTAALSGIELISNSGYDGTQESTYVGGIFGLNETTLNSLTLSVNVNVGNSNTSYVGAIAGKTTAGMQQVTMNKNSASGASVTGKEYVGGWFGEIGSGVSLNNATAGDNNSIKITSVGGSSYVGGIAGLNRGTLQNFSATTGVTGNDNVGGIVGHNESGAIISNSTNGATINALQYAGGIAGLNSGTISGCVNNEVIDITAATNVGGIAGSNIGGIAGSNTGEISGSTNNKKVVGKDNVGGIAGTSSGTIESSTVGGGEDTNTNDIVGGMSNVGGIAGLNSGTITKSTVGLNVQYATFEDGTRNSYDGTSIAQSSYNIGGIAGKNTGTIGSMTNSSGDANILNDMKVVGHTIVGGVVGYNRGAVYTTNVTGSVEVVMLGIYSAIKNAEFVSIYYDSELEKYLGTNVELATFSKIKTTSLRRALVSSALYSQWRYVQSFTWDIPLIGEKSFENEEYYIDEGYYEVDDESEWRLCKMQQLYHESIEPGNDNMPKHAFYGVVGKAIGYDGSRTFRAAANDRDTIGVGNVGLTGGNVTIGFRDMQYNDNSKNVYQLRTIYGNDCVDTWEFGYVDNVPVPHFVISPEVTCEQAFTIGTHDVSSSSGVKQDLIGVFEAVSRS